MEIIKDILLILVGISSGGVVAGGIFAFIAVIGVVPRFANRSRTEKFIRFYEDMIMLGGIWGSTTIFLDYTIPMNVLLGIFLTFTIGVFIGGLAVSLAEVFDVVPIFMRRARLLKGIVFFVTAIALGKTVGSLAYFLIPGFYR